MNLTKLAALVSLSVIYLLFGLLGSGIQVLIGVPGAAGIIMGLMSAMCMVLSNLIMRRFGAATIMTCIYSILALPLPLLGTPGFFPKILVATGGGLIADVVFLIFRKSERLAAIFTGAIGQLAIALLFFGLGVLFNMPGIEAVIKILLMSCVALTIMGAVGGVIGLYVYRKIENTALIRRIQK